MHGLPALFSTGQVKEAIVEIGVPDALEKRRQEKLRKYRVIIETNNLLFKPLVVDCFGSWNEDALKLFRFISIRKAEKTGTDVHKTLKYMMTRFSVCLQKMNAAMLVERHHAF